MKKWLAVLLSVVMTMSLTVPAFAADATGAPVDGDAGFFTVNGLPVPTYQPGDPLPINALPPESAPDTALGIIGGADGPTAIISTIPLEGLAPDMTWEELPQQQQQELIVSIKEALGGVSGQIGVMVNGEYVQFPDAVPEMKDGCVMVPIRALAEVLGGQVAYGEEEKDQLLKKPDKTFLTFNVDSRQVIVDYPSGNGELRTLSCAPYIKDGRAYVPVRFMGEVLGYEVGWDSQFQTAILLDRDALAAEIDKNFTILNKVQAGQSLEKGRNYSAEMEGSLTVTAFDTLHGDKTYKVDLSGQTLLNSEAVSGTCSLTLSNSIVDLLTKQYGYLEKEELERMRTVLKGLKDMEVIMNREGQIWVHAPVLDQLGGKENLWAGYDMDLTPELAEAVFSGTGTTTIGTAIAALVNSSSVTEWAEITQAVEFMTALYGDKNFTTSKGVSTLTIGPEKLAALSGLDADDVKEAFKECRITMKVDEKGGATVTCKMETVAQNGMPAIRITMDCTQSGGEAAVTMTVHAANVGEAVLEFTTTQKSTSEKPKTQPPAGAAVTDTPALLNP